MQFDANALSKLRSAAIAEYKTRLDAAGTSERRKEALMAGFEDGIYAMTPILRAIGVKFASTSNDKGKAHENEHPVERGNK